ncbi:unnamed protein product [Polarella glacialis]|uniref:Uncharacterized protein n=1 Tax=Polarella glacialis TaxID=89957 RepID=A0A813KHQ9_POLGL|nr:unnamed protein product [Polarella glacialis]
MAVASKYFLHCNGAVAYEDFLEEVGNFQNNMQDSALWAVFCSFDTEGRSKPAAGAIVTELSQPGKSRELLMASFPQLPLDSVLFDFKKDPKAGVDYESLYATLQKASADKAAADFCSSRRKLS